MVVAKVWYLTKYPKGKPTKDEFTCKTEELPSLRDGDVIVEAKYLSVDPYMRYVAKQIPLDSVMVGASVSRVTESKNPIWPVGTYLMSFEGWRTHTLINSKKLSNSSFPDGCIILPDMKHLPKSLGVGVIGPIGNTALYGFLDICQPKAGETVLVNAAAGAVGSLVVQMAKMKGCKVIAFAGTEEKVAYAKELGADHAFNYKTTKVSEVLEKVAPEKINCYFDNVGGEFTANALPHMAQFGRVSICGVISTYNEDPDDLQKQTWKNPYMETDILWKQLRIEGFLCTRWSDRWTEGLQQMTQWVLEGKIKYRETVFEGFDKMPDAFIGLFSGDNIGKAVVKV